MAFITSGLLSSRYLSKTSCEPFSSKRPHFVRNPPRKPVRITTISASKSEEVLEGPFKGHYGSWNFTRQDANDVTIYRLSLLAGAISTTLGILLLNLPNAVPPYVLDVLYIAWFFSMAISLDKVHIYVKPLHQALKFFLYAGLGLTIFGHFATPLSSPFLVRDILSQRVLMFAVAPQMAALTGLFFKEAFCFQRLEAVALTFLVPIITLRGLTGAGADGGGIGDKILLTIGAGLYVLFAARKQNQEKRDDLGDKSVFEYLDRA